MAMGGAPQCFPVQGCDYGGPDEAVGGQTVEVAIAARGQSGQEVIDEHGPPFRPGYAPEETDVGTREGCGGVALADEPAARARGTSGSMSTGPALGQRPLP
ncbi:hypothetical protein GCM10010251_25470 [Streptomyces aurantiogriseus]|uniref:Uncharacterized protein n=1 Tax=Streptomyces aurantiogriseus TaxID=66870 RepID=A0A918C8C8_9ACTN|nr:hypothetical protein GCM10010251_25470 [Streptomyces aurantiogriseus]